jgi:hypothetical protein
VANVTAIADNKASTNNQTYGYDHRDRLTSWTLNGTTQSYAYNEIGNLTSKAGVGTYSYPAAGAAPPHTPRAVNGASYSYDLDGDLTGGSGRGLKPTISAVPFPSRLLRFSIKHTAIMHYVMQNARICSAK